MKIKYVGVKEDGETAFSRDSGIERWMPGDSFDVPDPVGVKMLQHPDVFARDAGKPAKTKDAELDKRDTVQASAGNDTANAGGGNDTVQASSNVDVSGVTLAPGGTVAPATTAVAATKGTAPAKKAAAKSAAKKAAKKAARK